MLSDSDVHKKGRLLLNVKLSELQGALMEEQSSGSVTSAMRE